MNDWPSKQMNDWQSDRFPPIAGAVRRFDVHPVRSSAVHADSVDPDGCEGLFRARLGGLIAHDRNRQCKGFAVSSSGTDRTQCDGGQELTMLGKNCADEELKRGLGLSIKEIEPFLRAGGDAA